VDPVEELLAGQLEWRANSRICLRFGVRITVDEVDGALTAHGSLAPDELADADTMAMWELLCGGSPYFRLVLTNGSAFYVEVHPGLELGEVTLTEFVGEPPKARFEFQLP
jgi:hypothetical protein